MTLNKKGGKMMEMQSMLTQMMGLFGSDSLAKNMGSQKVNGKSGVAFQDYMSNATKQNESTGVKIQELGNNRNMTADASTEQNAKRTETANTVSSAVNGTGNEESVMQEVQIPNEEKNANNDLDSCAFVQEWKEEVKELLCEEFDLTEEDLEKIMFELGMQFVDLQNLPNIQQLVLAVAGSDDKTALLTNEVLAKQVSSLEETIKQISTVIMQEYEMGDEEITNYLAQDAQLEEMDSLTNVEEQPLDKEHQFVATDWKEMMPNEKAEDKIPISSETQDGKMEYKLDDGKATEEELLQQDNVTEVALTEASAINQGESGTLKMKKAEMSTEKDSVLTTYDVSEEKAEPKISVTVEKTEENLPDGEKDFSHSDKREDAHGLFEHFVENLFVNRGSNVEQPDMKMDAIAQMREIVTQVVEQIKVRVNADTTSMEVQLNPENLGKVNLTVVAKEGHITAQFITESEIARQALEGQIQQLRENLGEQGLKVDEVEVSVSNFDFSHSNQANAEEQKQHHSQEQRRVQRNLNLNDAVNLNDLTEEEQLAARIMADNGNQVDYTA
ncbi:MAG: flagellar hook-length control protein FliK [Lachnospiraceae bacterium]|nr:flagellar hook-length control protein FliK [Lachnospiraceae bacterium]